MFIHRLYELVIITTNNNNNINNNNKVVTLEAAPVTVLAPDSFIYTAFTDCRP